MSQLIWLNPQYGEVSVSADHGTTQPALRDFGEPSGILAVAYNGDKYCGVGSDMSAVISLDGYTWKHGANNMGTQADYVPVWVDIVWNGSIFCAISPSLHPAAATGRQFSATSPDGITWTAGVLPTELRPAIGSGTQHIPATLWKAIAWNARAGVFCAISDAGHYTTSADGTHWTLLAQIPYPPLVTRIFGGVAFRMSGGPGVWTDIASDGSIFCAVGLKGLVSTSPDGITWTVSDMPVLTRPMSDGFVISYGVSDWTQILHNGSVFCALNAGVPRSLEGAATTLVAATSTDGVQWTSYAAPMTLLVGLTQLVWDGAYFTALDPTWGTIIRSADGVNWEIPPGGVVAPFSPSMIVGSTLNAINNYPAQHATFTATLPARVGYSAAPATYPFSSSETARQTLLYTRGGYIVTAHTGAVLRARLPSRYGNLAAVASVNAKINGAFSIAAHTGLSGVATLSRGTVFAAGRTNTEMRAVLALTGSYIVSARTGGVATVSAPSPYIPNMSVNDGSGATVYLTPQQRCVLYAALGIQATIRLPSTPILSAHCVDGGIATMAA